MTLQQPGAFNVVDSARDELNNTTARWTSSAFQIRFGQVSRVRIGDDENDGFRLSAWGLSRRLAHLLDEYDDETVADAIDWLAIQQSQHVAFLLDQSILTLTDQLDLQTLDQVFITIDNELYLPRGFRMIVTCVTNIVQASDDSGALDKFVAVLDTGEAEQYVSERRDMISGTTSPFIH